MSVRQVRRMIPLMLGIAVLASGAIAAKNASMGSIGTSSSAKKSMKAGTSAMGSATTTMLYGMPSDVLIGAAASPAMGVGNGTLYIDRIGRHKLSKPPWGWGQMPSKWPSVQRTSMSRRCKDRRMW